MLPLIRYAKPTMQEPGDFVSYRALALKLGKRGKYGLLNNSDDLGLRQGRQASSFDSPSVHTCRDRRTLGCGVRSPTGFYVCEGNMDEARRYYPFGYVHKLVKNMVTHKSSGGVRQLYGQLLGS